jgi:hypothetical protein
LFRCRETPTRKGLKMNAELIDRPAAAEYLGVSPGTLANWQSTGFRRVPHIKIGKRVKYRISDLNYFIEANLVDAISDTECVEV